MRLALLAGVTAALSACIDTPLSLGHHEALVPPTGGQSGSGGSGGTMNRSDAGSTPPMSGGQGGGLPMELDSGFVPDASADADTDAQLPLRPCDDGTWSAQLECQVQDGFIGPPGAMGSQSMSTTSTLTVTQRTDRSGVAVVTGQLAFNAWDLSFRGRIEGELDCTRNTFRGLIFDGQVTSPGMLPGTFFGQLEGSLDPNSGSIAGPWWHGPSPDPQSEPRCTGPWAASRN